jgi:hypothetical protein
MLLRVFEASELIENMLSVQIRMVNTSFKIAERWKVAVVDKGIFKSLWSSKY